MKNFLARLFGKKNDMNIDITIIGTGNMGRALATRSIAAGKSLQVLARSTETAATFAAELGTGIASGNTAEVPAGRIVVLALPFDAAKEYVAAQGSALDSKILVDITNPVDFATFDSLTTPAGSSAAEEISALTSATVVKAFNTTFAGPLTSGSADGKPLDVFVAGEESARSEVAAFVIAAGMRPLEVGGLHHARELEGFQLLVMAMQVNPALPDFNWGTALTIVG
ncbi:MULTISPECIES: NADPH-dependent F420 reductase [Paeniglutamicibacter]|uniref:Dinucleotide-binding enzyme n=1 Tax=Paeniglutamicibacter sulfureus TaxID=43666 RepID=A0ABU2BNE8_9MICC|nr:MULTISPECIES: NAD(P)-binding domain-containing protein [Paeniglutamicibacter]MCV9994717.1 NAD(P)-binding domain-containing protein [Paeniglutamicibacter sp. ZC-3]MDR7359474.1 putative dinucleotide-binding enzyme [Paeniglutamicibacter sulfureus]